MGTKLGALLLTAGLALARFTLGGSGLDLTTRPADLWQPGHFSGPVPDGWLNTWGSP